MLANSEKPMLSLERRRLPKVAIGAWALTIAATPCAVSSQPKPSVSGAEVEQQLVERIGESESTDGPYSIDLLDPLSALAEIYEGSGDHGLALATLDQALQIVRVNRGLYSLDQAPLLRASIRADEAGGNAAAAWNVEQQLLALAKRNSDDLRVADIFRGIGDRRMNVLRRYVAGEYPPEIVLGCYYTPGGRNGPQFSAALSEATSCTAGSRNVVIRSILTDAWHNYLAAIRVLAKHGMYSSQELHEIETGLIHSGYEYHVYELGRQSYARLIAYNAATNTSWLDKVEMAIQMADWDLLFRHYAPAVEVYEGSYALLERKNVPPEAIARIFSPDVPVVLPTFQPNPLVSRPTSSSDVYIDVRFDVDLLGDARHIRIDGSKNASREAKKGLVHLIAASHFRPRITNGQIERRSPIALRYYPDTATP